MLEGKGEKTNKQTQNSLELRPPKRSDLDPLCRRQLGSGSSEAEALTATAGVVGFFIFFLFFVVFFGHPPLALPVTHPAQR